MDQLRHLFAGYDDDDGTSSHVSHSHDAAHRGASPSAPPSHVGSVSPTPMVAALAAFAKPSSTSVGHAPPATTGAGGASGVKMVVPPIVGLPQSRPHAAPAAAAAPVATAPSATAAAPRPSTLDASPGPRPSGLDYRPSNRPSALDAAPPSQSQLRGGGGGGGGGGVPPAAVGGPVAGAAPSVAVASFASARAMFDQPPALVLGGGRAPANATGKRAASPPRPAGAPAQSGASSAQLPPLPYVAQPFAPGSAAALRAQRSTVSVGFSGACSGALVMLDGRAWVLTSTESVYDAAKSEYLKLVQMGVRSPCVPKHFTPDALFVCSSKDTHTHSIAMLRMSETYTTLLAPLCVSLSAQVCALHTTLRGFQVEVPLSRRIFDEEHIDGVSSISALAMTIVQTRSEFAWRALPDVAASVNAVAGATVFDAAGDVLAVVVGTGTMLTATAFHNRWDSDRRCLAADTERVFLQRDLHMSRMRERSFAGGTLAGGAGGSGSNFVNRDITWDAITLTTLECAVALDELIASAGASASLAVLAASAPAAASRPRPVTAAGAAAAKPSRVGTAGASSTLASPSSPTATTIRDAAAAAGSGAVGGASASSGAASFAPMRPPSAAAMAVSAVLPRMLRMGTQPVSWCLAHALDASTRRVEVQAGSVKMVHLDAVNSLRR